MSPGIDIDQQKSPMLRRIFERYANGRYSLTSLREALIAEDGVKLNRAYLEKILKNVFYIGRFVWRGVEYPGCHAPLVSPLLFQRAQDVFSGRNKPKYRKHDFAFAGLLRCAHDGCTVTTERQKGKYVYYRCSHGRGRCGLPYMREQEVSERLGELLKGIYVPEKIARSILHQLRVNSDLAQKERHQQLAATQQRLAAVRTRMNTLYEDKLDGKIDEEFWSRKMAEYRAGTGA